MVEKIDVKENSGLAGNQWFPICQKCQIEVAECCRDLEMTLFPDELELFQEYDHKHVKKYKDGTYGYKTKRCVFLLDNNQCQLQKTGKEKPLDCIIYPLSFKNGKMFIDSSCWAKRLLDVEKASKLVEKKIVKYPHYQSVEYFIRDTDIFYKNIPLIQD